MDRELLMLHNHNHMTCQRGYMIYVVRTEFVLGEGFGSKVGNMEVLFKVKSGVFPDHIIRTCQFYNFPFLTKKSTVT